MHVSVAALSRHGFTEPLNGTSKETVHLFEASQTAKRGQ